MKDYLKEISSYFVKRYENSNRCVGGTSSKSIILYPNKHINGYKDDFDVHKAVNEEIAFLHGKGYVCPEFTENNVCKMACFVESADSIDFFYSKIKRTVKAVADKKLKEILEKHITKNQILEAYCSEQLSNLSQNKSIKFFNGDYIELEDVLKCVYLAQKNESDILIREFSIRNFKNSKRVEQIQEKVKGILFEYGDFAEKSSVFDDLSILKTPSFIALKGNGIIEFADQSIDLFKFKNGIALTAADIKQIISIKVTSEKVVSIENLTTYYSFPNNNALVLYLGGFHNTVRRNLVKIIYAQNQKTQYFHFGDIDAGGIMVFEHLVTKTEVPFKPIFMDIETLTRFKDYCIELTENDKKRLRKIDNNYFNELIAYMLKNSCKLEQEAVMFDE